ncbi:hypothetical protein D6C91_05535 [Aureobasidium pullulans]|uniref:Uncharacterized protein n=1 Tax=Aureobasidium pullulans TaxID=5580 RepID=A0A4V4KJD5_AURPU|nr:hypothetical protein D6C91_05535 [Aureobasidium pullulans]
MTHAFHQVIRPEPVVVRVPIVVRVPVPGHLGPWDAPHEPTAPAPRAPSPPRSPILFMHGMNRHPLSPAQTVNLAPVMSPSTSNNGPERRTTAEEAGTNFASPPGGWEFAPPIAYTHRPLPSSRRQPGNAEDEERVPRYLPPLPSSLVTALADLAVRQEAMVDEGEGEDADGDQE